MAGISKADFYESNLATIKRELIVAHKHPVQPVDIIIIVHNQAKYIRDCLESVKANTTNYRLMVHDNASDQETKEYLKAAIDQPPHFLSYSGINKGFIGPNNFLSENGKNPYIVLLNSDTVVQSPIWVQAMTSTLIEYPEIGVVGMRGGIVDENGKGTEFGFGREIDYVEGWCLCIARETYQKCHPKRRLFDNENLKFAYGEDADLSLRLRENGLCPYALHLDCVFHHGNVTAKEVAKTQEAEMRESFESNHRYLKQRWGDYFKSERVRPNVSVYTDPVPQVE
jgi:GT2 family glycosyltransferase